MWVDFETIANGLHVVEKKRRRPASVKTDGDGKDAHMRDQRDERQRGGSVCDLSGRREEM